MKWRKDIVGLFSQNLAQKKIFLFALSNYYSKLIVVEAFVVVKDKDVKNFV